MPVAPTPSASTELKLELLAGSVALDFQNCRRTNGEGASASFMHLMRTVARSDGVYLIENDENCLNAPDPIDSSGNVPGFATSVIRKVSGQSVQQWKRLCVFSVQFGVNAPMLNVRHASGFYLSPDGQNFWVSSYVAARSIAGYLPDADELALYNATPRSLG